MEFRNGQKLKRICINDGAWHTLNGFGVIDIEVCMECGQMAGVAWALVTHTNGKQVKVNLALCESVEYLLDEKGGD